MMSVRQYLQIGEEAVKPFTETSRGSRLFQACCSLKEHFGAPHVSLFAEHITNITQWSQEKHTIEYERKQRGSMSKPLKNRGNASRFIAIIEHDLYDRQTMAY